MQDILQQGLLEWPAVVELWRRTAAGIQAAQGTLVVPPGGTLADCIQHVPWRGHNPVGKPLLGGSQPGRGRLEGLLHNLHLSKEINILYCISKKKLYILIIMDIKFCALQFADFLDKLPLELSKKDSFG